MIQPLQILFVFVHEHENIDALPGVMGKRGIMSFISGKQGNTSLKMNGTGEQM